MTRHLIPIIELERLVREGNSVSEIGRKLKFSKGAVSKALKRLNIAVAKHAVTRAAPVIVERRIRTKDKLYELIDKMEAQLKLTEENTSDPKKKDFRDNQNQLIKLAAEIRKLLSADADISFQMYDRGRVEQALIVTLDEIGKESHELQARIRHRLQRSSLDFPLLD